MNNNLKLLIKELEIDGKWRKGVGCLHNNLGTKSADKLTTDPKRQHCCLGVAECLMPKEDRAKNKETEDGILSERYHVICKWLGLSIRQASVLAAANDGVALANSTVKGFSDEEFINKPQTFKQIAKLIRSKRFKDLAYEA